MPKYYEFVSPVAKKSLAKEKGIPEDIADLIEFCLQLDPKRRPTASQIIHHNFFSEFGGVLTNERIDVQ